MPGGGDTADRIRVKTDRSNSKADTFFPAPKELGRDERHVDRMYLDRLTGDITGNTEITDLTGQNLSVSNGELQASGGAPSDASYVTTASESGLSNETVAGVLSDVYGAPVGVGAADLRFNDAQAVEDASGNPHITVQDAGNTELERTVEFVGLTGTPTFGGHDHTAGGMTTIPAGGLATPYTDLSTLFGTPVSVGSTDLRLATGQSIEDGGGTIRMGLRSGDTIINGEGGTALAQYSNGSFIRELARSTTPWRIQDKNGRFIAVEYVTSSASPGTLGLTNAELITQRNLIRSNPPGNARTEIGYNTSTTSTAVVAHDIGTVDGTGSRTDTEITLIDASGNRASLFVENGELKAADSAGNVTTLT